MAGSLLLLAGGEAAGRQLVKGLKGRDLLKGGAISRMKLSAGPGKATLEVVRVKGQEFTRAVRAETLSASDANWDIQVFVPVDRPVQKGDVVLGEFSVRCLKSRAESGQGLAELVFERGASPWEKSIHYSIAAGSEWKKFHVPFVVGNDFAAGEANISFRIGYEPQTIEIGGVRFVNYGPDVDIRKLPRTKITYRGMAEDAPWRAAARARIEKHRKATLTVRVTDGTGASVPGARVTVRMKRHAFAFGSEVGVKGVLLDKGTPDGERFREAIGRYFNIVTIGDALKWRAWEGDWGKAWTPESAVALVNELAGMGVPVRGHVLVWPGWDYLPKSLRELENDPEALRRRVREHIREVAGAVAGKLVHWDVINEPFNNHALMDILGKDEMVEWFKEARRVDPKAELYLNDYAILSGGGGRTRHRDHFEETIRFLLDKGAPLEGLGMQGHFGSVVTAPEEVLAILDRYAAFNLPIVVSEYDHRVDDESFQAAYMRDFLTAIFSHPAVKGFVMWGFWDGLHWLKNAPMFREDWSLKPSGQAFIDLVFKEWWTNAEGKTDEEGEFRVPGFLGDYEVKVEVGDGSKVATGRLGPKGLELKVTLD